MVSWQQVCIFAFPGTCLVWKAAVGPVYARTTGRCRRKIYWTSAAKNQDPTSIL